MVIAYVLIILFASCRYGCPTCTVKGEYSSECRKVIFPILEDYPLRTSETYRHHLHIASTTGNPAFGIKGATKLSDLLRIPEQVPFDPMHLLYLGINKSLLNAILKCISVDLDILSATIDQIKVPHYFRRSFVLNGRKNRPTITLLLIYIN